MSCPRPDTCDRRRRGSIIIPIVVTIILAGGLLAGMLTLDGRVMATSDYAKSRGDRLAARLDAIERAVADAARDGHGRRVELAAELRREVGSVSAAMGKLRWELGAESTARKEGDARLLAADVALHDDLAGRAAGLDEMRRRIEVIDAVLADLGERLLAIEHPPIPGPTPKATPKPAAPSPAWRLETDGCRWFWVLRP